MKQAARFGTPGCAWEYRSAPKTWNGLPVAAAGRHRGGSCVWGVWPISRPTRLDRCVLGSVRRPNRMTAPCRLSGGTSSMCFMMGAAAGGLLPVGTHSGGDHAGRAPGLEPELLGRRHRSTGTAFSPPARVALMQPLVWLAHHVVSQPDPTGLIWLPESPVPESRTRSQQTGRTDQRALRLARLASADRGAIVAPTEPESNAPLPPVTHGFIASPNRPHRWPPWPGLVNLGPAAVAAQRHCCGRAQRRRLERYHQPSPQSLPHRPS